MKEESTPLLLPPPPPPQRVDVAARVTTVSRSDGWSSVLSGLGTTRDKRTSLSFSPTGIVDKTSSMGLYVNDGLARRIIDILPEDMFREWGFFQNDPTDLFDEGIMQWTCTNLSARAKFQEAKVAARITGGALLFIGVSGTGKPSTPLKPERIKSFDFLMVFDLNEIVMKESVWDTNIQSPTYGQIIQYRIKHTINGVTWEGLLHATRCIEFKGHTVPRSIKGTTSDEEARYWGIPELVHIYSDLQEFRGQQAAVGALMQELVIGKYTFQDLDKILSDPNGKRLLQNRLDAIESAKSQINAVPLGEGEKYERDNISLSAVPEVIDRAMIVLAAVAGYPVTKLWGRSAAGLNATGDGDKDNYYDRVRAERTSLDPAMRKFSDILAAAYGIIEDHSFVWNSLYQQTLQQENEALRVGAESFRTFVGGISDAVTEGLMTPDEGRLMLINQFAKATKALSAPKKAESGTKKAPSKAPGAPQQSRATSVAATKSTKAPKVPE